MADHDKRSTGSLGKPGSAAEGLYALNIVDMVLGLVADLEGLRSGAITIPQARARSQLAHEIFRGINLVIVGQRMIEGKAKLLNAPVTAKKQPRRNGRVIDG